MPACHRNHVASPCVRVAGKRSLLFHAPARRNVHQPPPNTRRVTGGPSGVWSSPTKPPAPHQSPLHLAHHTNSSPRPPKHKPQISATCAAASFVCRGEERKWRRPRACSWGWATPSSTSPPSSTTPSWQSKRSSSPLSV
jgi:hypothetical protein